MVLWWMRARQSPFLCQEWSNFFFSTSGLRNDLSTLFHLHMHRYIFSGQIWEPLFCVYILFHDVSQDLLFPLLFSQDWSRTFSFRLSIEVCRYVGTYMHTLLTLPAWYYMFSPWRLHVYILTCIPNLALLGVWNWSETHHGPHLSPQCWPTEKG